MIIDLHSHYPMHLLVGGNAHSSATGNSTGNSPVDDIRAFILRLANHVANYPGAGDTPAVTIDSLVRSDVRVALSVLYAPFDEMDVAEEYGAPPTAAYFVDLLNQIDSVEVSVTATSGRVVIAHNPRELTAAIGAGKVALVHAVEGGFHLGDTAVAVQANVETLRRAGVAYITLAHLFWRQIATNAPALPFLSDVAYGELFHQPSTGLGALGQAAVRAMAAERILVDVTHMSERSFAETVQLLHELGISHGSTIPFVATHGACRFGNLIYNLSDQQIRAIADHGGLIGLIACKHYMSSGLSEPETLADSIDIVCRHIDRIHDVTGSHDFTAFGSDHDGFIKPALPGLEAPDGYTSVAAELIRRYGAPATEQICSGNALRVLQYWQGRP